MKKLLLFLFLLPLCTLLKAQEIDKGTALKLIRKNSTTIGLTEQDIQNAIVSNAYTSNPSGIQLVYLQQSYKDLPVFNQLHVLAFRDGILVSKSGGRIKGIETKTGSVSTPSITAESAVRKAMMEKQISTLQNLVANISGKKVDFGKLGIANENITAELMWVPIEDGKAVRLAWQVYLVPKTTPDYFLIRIDAQDNSIIGETNLTVYCNWDAPKGQAEKLHDHNTGCSVTASNTTPDTKKSALDFKLAGPSIVNGASYRVIPFPAESPMHPGGAHALVTDPWTAAPGNATTLKWHNDGLVDYNITRGNNVWAREDRLGTSTVDNPGLPATSTTGPDPLTFNFVPNFSVAPTQITPVPNQQFNITNLFYWNNVIHDILYQYGFDEPAGNFQASNLGRGGVGNDYVNAQAQDGGGLNNANFSTPADGSRPRMQMYLFNGNPTTVVNTPSVIAGTYVSVESAFSNANKLAAVGPVTGQVVYYNDDAGGSTHQACVVPANILSGKIALIDRGNCDFTVKVKNAQNAGAIAVVMVNNVPGAPIAMGAAVPDNTIIIPAVMISQTDGAIIAAQLANNVTMTLSNIQIDGDVDNGVVVHEYAHGISTRLTGGPSQAGCLGSAEQMGEGWSDYYSMMITQDWATANVNTGFTTTRTIGTYALSQGLNGQGFRTQKYTTDFSVNNKVFTAILPTVPHDRGEIWCATLWDMTWNIIQQVNSITPNIYNATGNGGNIIALKLVTEGMKLQPCGPGFIDGRNAILQADQILYGGTYSCAIKEAFRRRGMGPLASQGSANSVTDQIPDFSAALSVKLTQNATQVAEGQNIVYTNTVTTCSPVSNYLLTDTLPANVTYVSGGTYNAGTRVVSFPITLTSGQTQTYSFTVLVNPATYFATTTLFNESFAAASLPATLTQTSTTANVWTVTNAQSNSAPNSVFSPNTAVVSDQILRTTSGLAMGANPSQLSFFHLYNTELSYDGGVVEISTNGGTTWNDLGPKMNLNPYNGIIDVSAGTPIAGLPAFTGLSTGFIKTSVNLSAYVNQTASFRWRFNSDNGTAGTGWYVDDIQVKSEPLVHMRSSLFNSTGVRLAYNDTVTLIIQAATCTPVSITTQPVAINACTGSNVTFTVVAAGTSPSYQWQVSTIGGTVWTNIAAATSATLTLTAVTASMNTNQYRVIVSNGCPSTVTSTAAILNVGDPAIITATPTSTTACTGNNATFSVTATGSNLSYQWQVSTNGGTTFTNIPGATSTTLTLIGVTASMNGNIYHVVISGCNATPLVSGNANLTVNSTAAITAQPINTNACTGGSATISVVATGTAISFQWQVSTDAGVSWTNIAGATSTSLTLNAVTSAMNNYRYRVIVDNSCLTPVTSNAVTLTVSDPAVISAQPVNSTICEGNNASFSVTATGTNITYQWQVSTDGGTTFTNISGATASTLTLTTPTPAASGNLYRVVIVSCSPTGLNSNAASLTVNGVPAISSQPVNVTACTGNGASFTVTATGAALAYQWQVSTDGGIIYTNIAGQTSATLALTNVTLAMNNNRYRVIINGSCAGPATSNAAILTVSNTATITTQPVNTTACVGNTATFTATASGTAYQWQVSTDGGTTWNNITGATTASLSLPAVTAAMNNNRYRLVVTGCTPTGLNSNSVTLTVNENAGITTQPVNTTVCNGSNATFAVTASGTGVSYQWQVSTDAGISYNNVSGATSASLTLTGVSAAMNNNRYQVVVSNTCPSSVSSTAVTLTVNNISVINAQPVNSVVCAGNTASFNVTATGSSPVYQWQVSTDGGTNYTDITGQTGASIALNNVTTNMNNNRYRVLITGCGTVTSSGATLTVNPSPIVFISASPSASILPDQSTTLTASSIGATVFSWFKNGNLVAGATTNTLVVTNSVSATNGLGDYYAQVTNANNCTGISNTLEISDSTINSAFIFPNPTTTGVFYVIYNAGPATPQARIISLYNAKGARVFNKSYLVSPHEKMEVKAFNLPRGVYIVDLIEASGKRLKTSKVEIF